MPRLMKKPARRADVRRRVNCYVNLLPCVCVCVCVLPVLCCE
jgi:hypothetical protein